MENLRIPVELNSNKNIVFKLEQDFDNLEVLSLKLSAYDVYAQMSSEFGAVVGRVSVNGGFGVQNAKVSVFIPITEEDETRQDIYQLYPFKSVASTLSNGVRYNIFPRIKQNNISHQPIGIFPDITDLMYYPTYLEVYEKYYKYTTITNNAGDYIIFGVPVGAQTIHMDFDLFDTNSFYLTANDLVTEIQTSTTVSAQLSQDLNEVLNPDFTYNENGYWDVNIKSDIDSMPNIYSGNNIVEVIPFWGNPDIREIGLSRCDFNINYAYTPTAIFFGSYINSAKDSGVITKDYKVGDDNRLGISAQKPAKGLKIIAYKHYEDYSRERFGVFSGIADTGGTGTGVFMISIPMYEDYYVTDEFGEMVPAPKGSKRGVPTKGHYLFEFFDDNDGQDGYGRRSIQSNSSRENTTAWLSPGIRVPATRAGDRYLCGWETANRKKSEFRYDIRNNKTCFYTTEVKFRKHNEDDIRLNGDYLNYLPIPENSTSYDYPIPTNEALPTGDVKLRGSLYSPRFEVLNTLAQTNNLTFSKDLTWVPWFPVEKTSFYVTKSYDWIFGVGVKDKEGSTKSDVFYQLYPQLATGQTDAIITWYFGDNPLDTNNPPTVNYFAERLSGEAEAIGRNISGVHYAFNLAVSPSYTCGLFVTSVEFGRNKVLYESEIVEVTDILLDLINKGVYSSHTFPEGKYEDYYYLFGVNKTENNALYKIKEKYFNEQ